MSYTLPPLSELRGIPRKTESTSYFPLPSIGSRSSTYYDLPSRSSSPPCSSSPPMTPSSTRHSYGRAYVRSSPRLSPGVGLPGRASYSDDLPSSWDRHYYPDLAFNRKNHHYTRSSGGSAFAEEDEFSELDARETYEDPDIDLPDARSDATDDVPGHSSIFDSDEDEEEEDEGEGVSFREEGFRATYFRTSAERGRWKSDPMPFQAQSFLQMRNSVPTSSSIPPSSPSIGHRRISEPALTTDFSLSTSILPEAADRDEVAPEPSSAEAEPWKPNVAECDVEFALPSLATDRESSVEMDEVQTPSSPLPPSSPPLSPMSVCAHTFSRSISPLSFAPSSPVLAPSSPLSMLSSLDYEELTLDPPAEECKIREPAASTTSIPAIVPTSNPQSLPEPEPVSLLSPAPKSQDLATEIHDTLPEGSGITPQTDCMPAPPSVSCIEHVPSDIIVPAPVISLLQMQQGSDVDVGIDVAQSIVDKEVDPPVAHENEARDYVFHERSPSPSVSARQKSSSKLAKESNLPVTKVQQKGKAKLHDKALKDREGNGVSESRRKRERPKKATMPIKETSDLSTSKDKRKKDSSTQEKSSEGPAHKKRRTTGAMLEASSTSVRSLSIASSDGATQEPSKKKAKSEGKRRLEENVSDSAMEPSLPKSKRQRRNDALVVGAKRRNKASASSSSSTASANSQASGSSATVDPETAALDAEIGGMLIETMALSRASSLPISTLYKTIMQNRPSLKEQRNEGEWSVLFERVLESGVAERGSGVFGKVESSGKDDSERPLEARWFYVPEQDEDQERATLIRSMMPRPAKRSETKKYKQYYWRPLDKISRWDPEDDL